MTQEELNQIESSQRQMHNDPGLLNQQKSKS